ncbi:hypothetical protein ACLMJK_008221 [Lecanora helva]
MLQKCLVRPNVKAVPGVEQVTPLDQYMVRVILPMMCVFKVGSTDDRPTILHDLKTGLALTIDEIRFLAADIIPENEDSDFIQLEYKDEDTGVWFYWQELPDIDFDALAKRNFAFSTLPAAKFVPQPRGHSERSPVLMVLVSFIQGGAIVTFNGHHAVMDAQGLGTFAQTWAKNVAATSEGRDLAREERLSEETLDGSSTFAAMSNRALISFPTYDIAETRSHEEAQAKIMATAISGDHEGLAKMVQLSHWHVQQESLDLLRDSVQEEFPAGPVVTQNALVSALIWRHVTKARGLVSRGVSTSSLLTSVNVRQRMDPPLAIEYPGNAIVLARATATASDLETESPLYDLARKIGDAIEWWDATNIHDQIGSIESCTQVGNAMVPPLDHDMIVTSPSRLGDVLGQANWSPALGKIQALRFAFPAFADGFVATLPAVQGGIDIMIWIRPETTSRLQKDEAWLKWVKLME